MDQAVGRFISPDPVKDFINPYSYVSNNPMNRIDPTGMRGPQYLESHYLLLVSDQDHYCFYLHFAYYSKLRNHYTFSNNFLTANFTELDGTQRNLMQLN